MNDNRTKIEFRCTEEEKKRDECKGLCVKFDDL